MTSAPIDPRLVLLARAAAKLQLIEAGLTNLDTAFDDLVPAFRQIAVAPCQCEREILDNWERRKSIGNKSPIEKRRRQRWAA
jgi:hypothetical protein